MNEEKRAIICAVRSATGFALDDLTFVLRHFLPHLNRDSIYRALKAEGLKRRPPSSRAKAMAASRTMIWALFTSTLNISPSCASRTVKFASASFM